MPEVILPARTWVDVYAASGISAGTAIRVQNKGDMPVYLVESAAEPTQTQPIPEGWALKEYSAADVGTGSPGVWALVVPGMAELFVQEVAGGGISPGGSGGSPGPASITPAPRQCLGDQTLSVTTSAVATLTVPPGALGAILQVDGNSSVSMTLSGVTNPTATVGLRLDDGVMFYADSNLFNVKMIARTGTVNVQVSYFDRP